MDATMEADAYVQTLVVVQLDGPDLLAVMVSQ